MAVAADFHRNFLIPGRRNDLRPTTAYAADDLRLFSCGDSVAYMGEKIKEKSSLQGIVKSREKK